MCLILDSRVLPADWLIEKKFAEVLNGILSSQETLAETTSAIRLISGVIASPSKREYTKHNRWLRGMYQVQRWWSEVYVKPRTRLEWQMNCIKGSDTFEVGTETYQSLRHID